MEQNIENKVGLIQKIATFAKENKKKLIFFFVIIIIFSFSLISLKQKKMTRYQKNILKVEFFQHLMNYQNLKKFLKKS